MFLCHWPIVMYEESLQLHLHFWIYKCYVTVTITWLDLQMLYLLLQLLLLHLIYKYWFFTWLYLQILQSWVCYNYNYSSWYRHVQIFRVPAFLVQRKLESRVKTFCALEELRRLDPPPESYPHQRILPPLPFRPDDCYPPDLHHASATLSSEEAVSAVDRSEAIEPSSTALVNIMMICALYSMNLFCSTTVAKILIVRLLFNNLCYYLLCAIIYYITFCCYLLSFLFYIYIIIYCYINDNRIHIYIYIYTDMD